MLIEQRSLAAADGVTVHDVLCRHDVGRGADELHRGDPGLVFVRRGCFIRTSEGRALTLDSTLAYCLNSKVEQRYDHPHAGGDECTAFFFEPAAVAQIWGGDPFLPTHALPTTPAIDLEHRRLLAEAKRGVDELEICERSTLLVAALLELSDARRVASGRPTTELAHQRLVDGVRETLNADLELSLVDLGRLLAVSPHHLSRIFSRTTGLTIARYRMRLRARAALERLIGGERSLARIAADVGFADQSHLCRVVRNDTSWRPAEIRRLLAPEA